MSIIQTISNSIKAAVGYQQSFDELLAAHDVTRAVAMMTCHSDKAASYLREYEVSTHKVMEREDRAVKDKRAISYAGASATKFLSLTQNSSMKSRWCFSMAGP